MIRYWTAASGSLLLFLFLVAVWKEITPEWKRYRHEFQRLQADKLRDEYERASAALEKPETQRRRAELELRLRQLQQSLSDPETQRRYREARNSLQFLEQRLERAEDRLRTFRADYQALEYELRVAEDKHLPGLRKRMDTLRAAIAQAATTRDDLKWQAEQAGAVVQQFSTELNQVSEELTRITDNKERLARELARLRQRSPEIEQVLLDELNVADRCATCHLGAVRGEAGWPVPHRRHPGFYLDAHPVSRFGCATCHGGQPRATTVQAAHGRVKHWSQPLIPKLYLGGACGKCHREEEVPFEPWLSDGRRLFAEAGCIGCHDIEGLRLREKIGPDLSKIGDKVSASWLARWLKNPKDYLPATRMPNFMLSDEELESVQRFLFSLRTSDSMPGFVPSQAPRVIERGEKLFRQSRCITCHAVNGRGGTLGPDLSQSAGKVRPGWLLSFLRDPRTYWPRTRMPRYRFSDHDLQALVAYMVREFQDGDWPPPEQDSLPAVSEQGATQGRAVVRKYGCYGCHDIPGFERATKVGAELNSYADKEVDRLDFGTARDVPASWYAWTRAKLKNPRMFREGLKMPYFAFSDEEIEALIVLLRSLSEENVPPGYRMPLKPVSTYTPEGAFGRLAEDLQCLTCHSIRGQGGSLAPDLTYEGGRVQSEWLRDFLRRPDTIRLHMTERMPQFQLRPEEIETIVNYMKTVLVHDGIPEQVFRPREITPALIAQGRKLYYDKYACQACHQIGMSGGAVGPELTQVSRRLTKGWLVAWLKSSQRLTPGVKEPQYNLSDEEARAIAAFLLSSPTAPEK